MRRYPVIVSLFLSASFMISLHAETNADTRVTIHVLSRQVRLLKSGSVRDISISMMPGMIIRDVADNRILEGKTITLRVHGKTIGISLDERPLAGRGKLVIEPVFDKDRVKVVIDSQVRTYPLPMTIQYDDKDPRIYVEERLGRYAVDSSLAEYSGECWKETEGILALAHVIRARYFNSKKSPRHGDADFCDLTHCQVYRGRIEGHAQLNDEWIIDHEKMSAGLFFHSRCGGRTVDPGIFTGKLCSGKHKSPEVRDWLYRDGTRLCQSKDSCWERDMGQDELARILFPGKDIGTSPVLLHDPDRMRVRVRSSSDDVSFPAETFRLAINRVKGWNFIRSNSFDISETIRDGKKYFHFKGEGLGHGAGLCQHGAMALSSRGYSRYEILEHYYPDLPLKPSGTKPGLSPYCSYCLFDASTGKVLSSLPERGFLQRTVPPGSVFKLIVALYIAAERPDIFTDHAYTCTGKNMKDPNLPEHCWKPKGHGSVRMKEALPNSCNLYFASLYKSISEKKFKAFYLQFCTALGIRPVIPEISCEREWAKLLAGLDFRVSFTVGDLIKIARYLYCCNAEETGKTVSTIPVSSREKMKIFHWLKETFTHGTAAERKKRSGPSCNYLPLESMPAGNSAVRLTDLWGKTATVIDGTNKPESYGLFIGGNGSRGIIVILRKGTGNMASRWARRILSQTAIEE